MHFSTVFASLALVASAVAAPLNARQSTCYDASSSTNGTATTNGTTTPTPTPNPETTFRFLGTVYCLVPTVNGTNFGPCEVSSQVPLTFDTNDNKTALTTVLGHSVNVTRVPVNFFGNYYVTIDGVLRNATGRGSPDNLFGAGITRSYDYPLA